MNYALVQAARCSYCKKTRRAAPLFLTPIIINNRSSRSRQPLQECLAFEAWSFVVKDGNWAFFVRNVIKYNIS